MKKILTVILLITYASSYAQKRYEIIGDTAYLVTRTSVLGGVQDLPHISVARLLENGYVEVRDTITIIPPFPKGLLFVEDARRIEIRNRRSPESKDVDKKSELYHIRYQVNVWLLSPLLTLLSFALLLFFIQRSRYKRNGFKREPESISKAAQWVIIYYIIILASCSGLIMPATSSPRINNNLGLNMLVLSGVSILIFSAFLIWLKSVKKGYRKYL